MNRKQHTHCFPLVTAVATADAVLKQLSWFKVWMQYKACPLLCINTGNPSLGEEHLETQLDHESHS